MKTTYEPPIVNKVRLEIKNAVLANCHSSPNITPKSGTIQCSVSTGCYNPPTPPLPGGSPIGNPFGN